jgi:4-hydroxy-3-methylbut-2-en-1-yl diphosphate synthase IspG/GcpE
MPQPQTAIIERVQAFMLRVSQIDVLRCPHCGQGTMYVIEVIAPSKQRAIPTTGPPL